MTKLFFFFDIPDRFWESLNFRKVRPSELNSPNPTTKDAKDTEGGGGGLLV